MGWCQKRNALLAFVDVTPKLPLPFSSSTLPIRVELSIGGRGCNIMCVLDWSKGNCLNSRCLYGDLDENAGSAYCFKPYTFNSVPTYILYLPQLSNHRNKTDTELSKTRDPAGSSDQDCKLFISHLHTFFCTIRQVFCFRNSCYAQSCLTIISSHYSYNR